MLFNSYIFILLFLPLVLIGYYGLNYAKLNKLAMCFLLGMSLWFYGYNNVYYLAILVGSVIANYLLSFLLRKDYNRKIRLFVMWTGVILNLGILFYFKYFDFFIENMNHLLKTQYTLIHVVLPLGISFYTFQQLSYVIDCYRNDCEEYTFIEYATYVTFFPQLIAGPIVYHSELIPQFRDESKKKFDYINLSKGIYAFALGLAKKVLIADTFSKVVTIGYEWIWGLNSPSVLIVIICYAFQIYFDFSGYCDMAYGIGYMFNIELPINFNSPYKADSIGDFWDRWHMTLTRFFTKYIYIPLGGSRRGSVRTYLNIMIVFLISGFWHGAAWTFVLWGVINGLGVALDRAIGKYFKKLPKAIRVGITFTFSVFAWSLFRAETVYKSKRLLQQMFCGGFGEVNELITDSFNNLLEAKILSRMGLDGIVSVYPWFLLVAFMLIVFVACLVMRNTQEKVKAMNPSGIRMAVVVVLIMWSIISLADVSEFLYFNF